MPAIAVEIRTVLNPIGLLLQRSPEPRSRARRGLRWILPPMSAVFDRVCRRLRRGATPFGTTAVVPLRFRRRADRESATSTNAATGVPMAPTPRPCDEGWRAGGHGVRTPLGDRISAWRLRARRGSRETPLGGRESPSPVRHGCMRGRDEGAGVSRARRTRATTTATTASLRILTRSPRVTWGRDNAPLPPGRSARQCSCFTPGKGRGAGSPATEASGGVSLTEFQGIGRLRAGFGSNCPIGVRRSCGPVELVHLPE